MLPMARIGDKTATGDVIIAPGEPSVLIEGMPASVIGDTVSGSVCTGSIISGSLNVLINGKFAAHVNSQVSGINPSSGAPVNTVVAIGAQKVYISVPVWETISSTAAEDEEEPVEGESGPRPNRGWEQEGEIAGVASIDDYGRYFYGIHTTRHGTICWGEYDNDTDECLGPESENTMATMLHYRQGYNDTYYQLVRGREDAVDVARYRRGGEENAHSADIAYRNGVQNALKDAERRASRSS